MARQTGSHKFASETQTVYAWRKQTMQWPIIKNSDLYLFVLQTAGPYGRCCVVECADSILMVKGEQACVL